MRVSFAVLFSFIVLVTTVLIFYGEAMQAWIESNIPLLFDPSDVSAVITNKEEVYIENSFYANYSPKFQIEDTDQITKNKNTFCIPFSFGFSVKEGEEIFPNFTYPPCSSLLKVPPPLMTLDYETNTFNMSCEFGTPYYALEPIENKGRLYKHIEFSKIFKVIQYTEPVKITVEEFVYGSCDGDLYNNAIYIPRFNKTLFEEKLKVQQKLEIKNKPLLVLILTIDSYSRRHFFRKLPKTVEFLNNLDSRFSVFDFKLHNIIGTSSIENMIPVFSDKDSKPEDFPKEYDVLKPDTMWNYFSKRGFVTLFGLEDCDTYFLDSIGRYPEIDYKIRSFYCAAKILTNFNSQFDGHSQRCIGSHMSHYYALNYIFEFSRLYSSINQWMYLHINSAHESTGQHAATLDDDMVDFLTNYLNTFGETNEIAIFLHADHGMGYGDFYKNIGAFQEKKLPSFFFIGSKSLLNRIPFSYDSLLSNTLRLTSKKDLKPTISYLADMPYFTPNTDKESKYLNLFTQKSNLNRTCEEASINLIDCSCVFFQEIKDIKNKKESYNLALSIIDESLSKVNFLVHSPTKGEYHLCKKLSFKIF